MVAFVAPHPRLAAPHLRRLDPVDDNLGRQPDAPTQFAVQTVGDFVTHRRQGI